MSIYELRDPVHSRITFDEFEKLIIDHPIFQRLRFISQLSLVLSYVYPGATQTRFSHSLGAMHVAGRIFGRLSSHYSVLQDVFSREQIEQLRRRVRIAGLLHDIGHGPFSHSSEAVFPLLKNLPLNWDWWFSDSQESGGKNNLERQAVHEDYSVLLVQKMSEDGTLDANFAQDVCSLIHEGVRPSDWFIEIEKKTPTLHRILKSIVSGEVDCDRMDYLLRDSHFCGVAYGHYDIDWLISSMSLREKEGRLIISISENGVRALESFLLARYHMIDQVYFHKTKSGFKYMLQKAISEREISLEIPTDPDEYIAITDGHVIELLSKAAKNETNYWSHHLMNRITAKRILRLHDVSTKDRETLEKLKEICEKENIHYFTQVSKSELSHLHEGDVNQGILFVGKKVLGGIEQVSILEYSDLIQKYNEKIFFTDFFILREDVEKFELAIRR